MATVHFGRLQGAAGFARSVAIKRLHPQYAKDPDFVAMFVDEARLAARIAHPNVVPTLDVVSLDNELLLVMEYVRGASLSRLLRTLARTGERVPVRIAAAVVGGVLHGLHAAHEAKGETGLPLEIVHRDVSPQNVLVGTDGIARVLDFGVAKAAGRWQSTREGQLKGKIAYMAPEQITTGSVTRRTDVYAAAVVLWETLTGRRLFRADNEAKLLTMVLEGDVPLPSQLLPGLPWGFDRIIVRGLERDPERRFSTAREMALELEAVVGTAPPTEVGDWVERVASDELRERANRIEEIERSVSSGPFSTSSASAARGGRTSSGPGRDRPSQESHLAMVHTDQPWVPPTRRRIRPWMAIAAGAAALFGCVTAIVVARHRPAPPAIAAEPAVPPPTPIAGGEPLLAAPTSVPSAAPSEAAPNVLTPPTPNPPSARPFVRTAKPPIKTLAPPRPDCTPPYTTDRQGHLHFKPACL